MFFSLGTEYRIIPFYSLTSNTYKSSPVNIDFQNSGVAFNYTFDFFVTKNLALGFSNSIRYDLITAPIHEITIDARFLPANSSLIFGFHFYLDYHFKIFKDSELFVRVGKSFLNNGTEYVETATFFDGNGNKRARYGSLNSKAYQPFNFALGYKKNKVSLTLGVYTSNITEYFNSNTIFNIPYINFKYNLGKL